jgi:hypothetical protein
MANRFVYTYTLGPVGMVDRGLDSGKRVVRRYGAVRSAADGNTRIQNRSVGMNSLQRAFPQKGLIHPHVYLADEGGNESRLHGCHDACCCHALDLIIRRQFQVLDAVAMAFPWETPSAPFPWPTAPARWIVPIRSERLSASPPCAHREQNGP